MDRLINSEEYWDKRFETDWNDCSGEKQTEFFAMLMCQMLPTWLIKLIRLNKYTVCDMGCACGDAVNVLSRFLGTQVSGIDFSDKAIEIAKQTYPAYHFEQGDINKLDSSLSFDVVYCSNVLEHFYNPWEIAEKITNIAKHYVILQMPFRELVNIDEHFYKFDVDVIPMQINAFTLSSIATTDGAQIENSLYRDQQILLVYSTHNEDIKASRLSDLSDGIRESDMRNFRKIEQNLNFSFNKQISELETRYNLLSNDYALVNDEFVKRGTLINTLTSNLEGSANEIAKYSELVETFRKEKEAEAELNTTLTADFENLKLEVNRQQGLIDASNEKQKCLQSENKKLYDELSELKNHAKQTRKLDESINKLLIDNEKSLEELNQKESIIFQARQQCLIMANSKTFKVIHFLFRIKYQWLKGNKEERKGFQRWIVSKFKKNGGDNDRRYNPIWKIINVLNGEAGVQTSSSQFQIIEPENKNVPLAKHLVEEQERLASSSSAFSSHEYLEIKKILDKKENKKILIYPHVVYWEPLQTPQQLLRAFAKKGWLCFFCEHPNISDIYREIEPDLYIVHEKELIQALGDTEVTILLTWLGSLSFVNKIVNKQIWYHILDKLDLFPYYDEYYLSLHNSMVKQADYVSYVASPLLNCLQGRNDVVYMPNATNPEEFLNVHIDFVPEDMRGILATGHKIIGYYGYIAEWMDYDLVRKAAIARPEYEFVFIGKAIYDTSKINTLSNVHLLGLKPYKELSDYAKFFDVATIPFVINEKMDCVSPIKFYEYCALGLPVITSRMKEMEAFLCEYVACVNGADEYLYYLDKFVQEPLKKMAFQYLPAIANQNTWISRVKMMCDIFDKKTQAILSNNYIKNDVIMFAVIDYDFRYQRPQHFAIRFARNGHRVFYINANHFNQNSITKIEDNLYVVNLYNANHVAIHVTDWKDQLGDLQTSLDDLLNEYCIRDAVTIVDYPNWIYAAEYLRSNYGFKVITDYMDDYTGFLNPAENLVKANCERLLKIADMVIPSSQFLFDIARKYNTHIEIVRNGTEFELFHKAAKAIICNKRKVVGYYGAVAEWFDCGKVIYLAEQLPECDFIIIGQVSDANKKKLKTPNIKLMGELPYKDLPKHLAYFDVCLIPFDTSTDLIKATNPVKFYEYLSAGKPIVATEIPELEPYKNCYVYMSNDNQQFLEYVKLCLTGNDSLKSCEDRVAFAKENDWQHRYEVFEKACKAAIPRVSIIVLTYNNLEINKLCVDSILTKTAYLNYELIIVDNLSTDGTREYLTELSNKALPNVKVILNDINSGFAGGNNIGIQNSNGNYVVLLNNDTIVTRGWLTALVKHLANDPQLGMCGPVTNSIGNEAKIKVDYHSWKELELFAYRYTTEHLNECYSRLNVLALFCTMIKREVIENCGLLDDAYEVGMFEDDDYAEAVRQAGYTLTIAEDVFIHHFEGASFKKLEDEKFKQIYECNKKRFEKKWNKKWITHSMREGITWDTNTEIQLIPKCSKTLV